ncbi:hypothetical protein LY76DRAFT_591377 [Colletotrichum caudatum]|nr:hypothetical protein LY76DRAFT_591377 [Colletotrichum caudatum]
MAAVGNRRVLIIRGFHDSIHPALDDALLERRQDKCHFGESGKTCMYPSSHTLTHATPHIMLVADSRLNNNNNNNNNNIVIIEQQMLSGHNGHWQISQYLRQPQ